MIENNEIDCYICEKTIKCQCQSEKESKQKNKYCATTKNYPRSQLYEDEDTDDIILIHICSEKCQKVMNSISNEDFIKDSEKQNHKVISIGEYTMSYNPKEMTEKQAYDKLNNMI